VIEAIAPDWKKQELFFGQCWQEPSCEMSENLTRVADLPPMGRKGQTSNSGIGDKKI
jgi:hypothetical protein